jgi:glycosyltransferase involved in cell wall biosynthesis
MKYKKTFFLNGIGFSENKISTEKRILNDVPMINLCSVGELNHNKNHFFVVKVLKKYNLDFIKYRIAGEGPLKSKLSKYILKHNLHNVELLGRVINMQSFYQECDLLVHPSHREGLAISPLEAMANGIPVIATNIRGLNDYVNNLNGYIIEKNDVLSFVKILKTIHKKPTELIIKGKRSILDSKKYSWNNLEIEISKIFKIIFNQ